MVLNKLEKAILLSISYSSVFDFPLKTAEIKLRLIGTKNVSSQDLKKTLIKLCKKKFLLEEKGFYFLPNFRKNLVLREKRAKIAFSKRKEAQKFVNFAKRILFIKAIAITGSLSTSNTNLNDDVDWLIMTAPQRLWLTRPLVLLIGILFSKKRHRNGDHKDNSWCFNMFLEETSLGLPYNKRNIYTAHEVCQADFVFSKDGEEGLFLGENRWVKRYLPGFYQERIAEAFEKHKKISAKKTKAKKTEKLWLGWLLDLINKLFYKIQYWYMKNHMTEELVQENRAFFHPRDTKREIMRKWQQILRKEIL